MIEILLTVLFYSSGTRFEHYPTQTTLVVLHIDLSSKPISNAGFNQDVLRSLVKSEDNLPMYLTMYLTRDF